jgi:AraC-like DNA-binding protein
MNDAAADVDVLLAELGGILTQTEHMIQGLVHEGTSSLVEDCGSAQEDRAIRAARSLLVLGHSRKLRLRFETAMKRVDELRAQSAAIREHNAAARERARRMLERSQASRDHFRTSQAGPPARTPAVDQDPRRAVTGIGLLERAVLANRDIGIAVGILMATRQLSREQAFDLLRTTSMNTHREIHDLADEVIQSGTLPATTAHSDDHGGDGPTAATDPWPQPARDSDADRDISVDEFVAAAFATTRTVEDHYAAHPESLHRAVSFIEANPHRELTAADIAAAAGVTVRAVQLAFRRHLDTTPMAYLRRVRLHLAHQDLLDGDPATDSVTAIGARWGLVNPSHFATLYRREFGQSPSHTLGH